MENENRKNVCDLSDLELTLALDNLHAEGQRVNAGINAVLTETNKRIKDGAGIQDSVSECDSDSNGKSV